MYLKHDIVQAKTGGMAESMADEEKTRRRSAERGGAQAGFGIGGAGGALLGHHLGKGALGLGSLGALVGSSAGRHLARAHDSDKVVHRQQTALAREQAQSDRKELVEMKKKDASYNSIMFAAMADELKAMDKVAINLAPITGALSGVASKVMGAAPKVMGALEGVGSRALTGATSLAGKVSPGLGQAVGGGLMRAGQAVGGGQNLSRIAGGALGVGALGVGGLAAKRVLAPSPRPVMMSR